MPNLIMESLTRPVTPWELLGTFGYSMGTLTKKGVRQIA